MSKTLPSRKKVQKDGLEVHTSAIGEMVRRPYFIPDQARTVELVDASEVEQSDNTEEVKKIIESEEQDA